NFYERFHIDIITYVAILAIGHTIESLQRLSQREAEAAKLSAELSKVQLEALRRQIEPHFLFNTLNGISGLVRRGDSDAAVGMIAGLSELLRRLLEDGNRQLVPLADELSFLQRYVDLQVMRFGNRLNVAVDVPIDLYGALVPNLILQPLVENAIVHGVCATTEGGTVRIVAARLGDALTLSIHNDGPALPEPASAARGGVGIANTRGRLRTLYGGECMLEVRNHRIAGVETVVRLPYQIEA
ncbi:MAG TPA: histidine kinase, partial [Vicinamibacterales bacterium]|nr:histidine kinase [Vicinamibacterales bacterium]